MRRSRFNICGLVLFGIFCSSPGPIVAEEVESLATHINSGDMEALQAGLVGYTGNFHLASKESLLQLCIKNSASNLAELLIKAGADVNGPTKGFRKKSHLHLAVESGDVAMAHLLLEHGSNVQAKDKVGQTPLIYAMLRENIEMIDLLFDFGAAEQASEDGGEGLLLTVIVDSPSAKVVDRLVSQGMAVSAGAIGDNLCIKCHNANGETKWDKAVNIAGQNAGYIKKQLLDFKSGDRIFEDMQKFMKSLTPSMMAELSQYYTNFEFASPTPITEFGSLENGENIYTEGLSEKGIASCSSCHENKNEPIDDFTPWLRGMTANYVFRQLENYKNSNRSNDDNAVMRRISETLEESELKDLAAYISTL